MKIDKTKIYDWVCTVEILSFPIFGIKILKNQEKKEGENEKPENN